MIYYTKLKIFKYILLLLLLFSFAFTVFVFTKDGQYNFEEKLSINLDDTFVLPYIEQNENWKIWFDFDYPLNKIAISDDLMSWDNQTKYLEKKILKDSLQLTSSFDKIQNQSFLKTIKHKNKTEIIWRGEGHMTFKEKLFYYLPFNTTNSFQGKIKNSLKNLNAYLTERYIKHYISIGKVELYPEKELMLFHFNSTPDSLVKNFQKTKIVLDSIVSSKSLKQSGEPFIIYNQENIGGVKTDYSVAAELVKDSIFYASKTKLSLNKTFYAIKVVLKGNYIYKKEVFNKLDKHLESINYVQSNQGYIIEKLLKNAKDILPENEWITEFYFPVKPLIDEQASTYTPKNQTPTSQPSKNNEPQRRETIQPVEQIQLPVEPQKTTIEVGND